MTAGQNLTLLLLLLLLLHRLAHLVFWPV